MADVEWMSLIRRWLGVAMMLAAPLVLLIILRVATRFDARFFSPDAHLIVVSAIAVLALIVAGTATVSARRSRQPGLVYLSCGAAGLGVFMLGHGLSTPGVLGQPLNPWVGRLPYAALLVFAAALYLASRPVGGRTGRWVADRGPSLVMVVVGSMAVATAVFVADPTLLPSTSWEENALDVLSGGVVVVSVFVAFTHWRRWLLGNDTVQLALTFAAAMTAAAAMSLEFGKFQQISWWDYHAYLLAGFGCAVYAIVSRSRKSRTVTDVLGSAFSTDAFEHIVRGYPDTLRQLVKAVEVKDSYTHGHSERTARVATELGLRMGLPSDVLRVIARGAYLHDVGKIGIPDAILNKPGRLTPQERKVIETHPELGYEIASSSRSLRETLSVILHHHERFDGDGYPHGLSGHAVPIEARIVAVADVWDALTSERAYRAGWPAPEALAHIVAGAGTHFDPVVVDAMVDLAAEWGIGADREPGSPDEAWEAAQTCHQIEDDAARVAV